MNLKGEKASDDLTLQEKVLLQLLIGLAWLALLRLLVHPVMDQLTNLSKGWSAQTGFALTVLQSSGVLSLLTSVTFAPPLPSCLR